MGPSAEEVLASAVTPEPREGSRAAEAARRPVELRFEPHEQAKDARLQKLSISLPAATQEQERLRELDAGLERNRCAMKAEPQADHREPIFPPFEYTDGSLYATSTVELRRPLEDISRSRDLYACEDAALETRRPARAPRSERTGRREARPGPAPSLAPAGPGTPLR